MIAEQMHSDVVDLGSYDVPCDLIRNAGFLSNTVVDDAALWGGDEETAQQGRLRRNI